MATVQEGEETPWTGRSSERYRLVNKELEYRHREMAASHIPPGEEVLDVGCGNQLLRTHLDCPYRGLDWEADLDPDIVADSTDIPLDDDEVAVAVAKAHLVHVPRWKETVREMLRVASDRVVLLERVWGYRTQAVQEEPVLFRIFNPDDLAMVLGDAAGRDAVDVYALQGDQGLKEHLNDERVAAFVRDL